MKWHKKMTDHLDDSFIQGLIHEFGGNGYLVYFGTVALVCRENKKELTGKAMFEGRYLKEKFHVSVAKIEEILRFCEGKGKLLLRKTSTKPRQNLDKTSTKPRQKPKKTLEIFEIDFPKILEIADDWSKKLRSKSVSASENLLHEVEGEVEEEYKRSKKKKNIKEPPRFSFSPEDKNTAELMAEKIREFLPNARAPNLESWANDIRLIREQDKKTGPEVRELFLWANADPFWRANIRSPAKLRKHLDTLQAQKMLNPKGGGGNGYRSQANINSAAPGKLVI